MKNIVIILSVFLFANIGFSQAPPQGINYQAVVYSDNCNNQPGLNVPGQLLLNQAIRVRFTIIANAANGMEVYKETHATTTDAFGMFSLVIGTGTQISSTSFSSINWGAGLHFLKVDIDKTGGTNYLTMSNQQLWSVPYALYSQHASTADSSTTSANATTADFATNSGHADSSDYADLAGNGITGIIDNGNGTLTFNYLDGSTYTTPVLTGLIGATGPQGPAGQNGTNGQSAYDLWLAQGNSGTQQDFLNSLQGAPGAQGPIGLTGATGPAGPQGTPGSLNAWSLTGNTGTNPTTNFIGTTDAQDWAIKTNNTERMRVTSAGNVGIGTSSPTEKLEILNGNINLSSPTFDANSLYGPGRIELYRGLNAFSPHTNGYIDFKDTVTDDYDFRIYYSNPTVLAPSGGLVFRSGPDASFNNRMTILNNGNVGIGTSSPSQRLEINNGNSLVNGEYISTGSNQARFISGDYGVIHRNDGTAYYTLLTNAGNQYGTWNALRPFKIVNSTGDVNIGYNTLFVQHQGNVGIGGTLTPSSKLNIFGGGIKISNSFEGIGFNGADPFETNANPQDNAKIYYDAGVDLFNGGSFNDALIIEKCDGNSAPGDGGIIFANRGSDGVRSSDMVIKANGNIGMGTNNPQRKVHINSVMRLEPISTAPTTPAKGDMYFDSTINKLRVFDGTVWQSCW
jgi:hypothetical protein